MNMVLILAGAALRVPTWWVLPLGLAYAGVRGVGKVMGGAALVRVLPLGFELPRRFGLGLIPQGGISLAMAVSLVLTFSGLTVGADALNGADVLFAIVVIGIVLSELAGPFMIVRVLRRAGEILPLVEEAIHEGDEEGAQAAAIGRSAKP